MNILLLSRYTALGASSRYRSYQYLPFLRSKGLDVTVAPLLTDDYVQRLYGGRGMSLPDIAGSYVRRIRDIVRTRRYDLIWIEYEALPWVPYSIESILLGKRIPFVVDYDDAVYHRYDLHARGIVRRILGRKIDQVMSHADLVIAGNRYLATRAHEAGARHVEILPTVIDLSKYTLKPRRKGECFTVGWIGSPSTEHYLALAREPLARLCRDGRARVVAIGARNPDLTGVPLEIKPWSEKSETELLSTFDAGIMPLADTPWERGKCGHKLIKYMASSLPVVASPVGVNAEIVRHTVNGFLASTVDEWLDALARLRDDASLGQAMGVAGRETVEQRFCTAVTGPILLDMLVHAAGGTHSSASTVQR
jgi:glycosyltransferase involved in cell wall biosynthesis